MKLVNRLKKLFSDYNQKGIPLPVVRDPSSGLGSITATMVVVSFGVAILLLAGKVVNIIGDVDYTNVLWLLGVSLSAYLGRKFQGNGKKITLGGDDESDPKEKSE